jgi:hypothetical protein
MAKQAVEKARPPKQKPKTVEIGSTGLKQSGGRIREELLKDLQGTKAAKIYREMSENDPIIGAFMFAVEQSLRQVEWKVKPFSQDAGHVTDAEFVDQCRQDMSLTWGDFITESLSMLVFGYAPFEVMFKARKGPQTDPAATSRYTDGRIGWSKFAVRAQETVEGWEFDPNNSGEWTALKQRTDQKGLVTIPRSDLLLFRTKSIKGNPEGRSILRNAYRPWFFKKRIEEIEGVGLERDLAGLPVLTSPEGLDIWNENDDLAKANKTAAEEIIRNLRRDEQEGVLLPYGWELELLASNGTRQFDTTQIINRYDQRIAMTVLADFILLGHGGKFGSFALAKSKTSAFTMSLVGYLNVIRDVINQTALPTLFALNGLDTAELPTLDYEMLEVPALDKLAQFLRSLTGAGIPLNEPNLVRHLLNLAGLPADLSDTGGRGGTGTKPTNDGTAPKKPKSGDTSGSSDSGGTTEPVTKTRRTRTTTHR